MTSGFDDTMHILARRAQQVRIANLATAMGPIKLTDQEQRMLSHFAFHASGDDMEALITLLTRLRN